MAGLFKIVVFFIIAVIWIIALSKRKGQWDEQIPDFPEEPDTSRQDKTPEIEEPSSEGLEVPQEKPQEETLQTKEGLPLPSPYGEEKTQDTAKKELTYEKWLALQKEKIKTQEEEKVKPEQTPELILAQASSPGFAEEEKVKSETPPFYLSSLNLKGDLKEGIMWSVILGPARSKEKFNIRTLPVKR